MVARGKKTTYFSYRPIVPLKKQDNKQCQRSPEATLQWYDEKLQGWDHERHDESCRNPHKIRYCNLRVDQKTVPFPIIPLYFIFRYFCVRRDLPFFLSIGRFGFTIVTIELVARHRIVRAPYRNFFFATSAIRNNQRKETKLERISSVL